MRQFILSLSLMLTACGSSDKGDGGGSGSTSDKPKTETTSGGTSTSGAEYRSIYVIGKEELPTCTDKLKNSLGYVSSEKAFYYCNKDAAWTAAEMKDNDTQGPTELWRFHTDSYADATDVDISEPYILKVGTCQLARFADGSAFVSVTMNSIAPITSTAVNDQDDVNHSFFLKPSKSEQEVVVKYSVYKGSLIRYKITLADMPTITIAVDSGTQL